MTYSVVLEEADKGGIMAWVSDLPGCFARAPTRAEVEAKLPGAIRDFLLWRRSHGDAVDIEDIEFEIVSHAVTPGDGADADTSIFLDADRAPLTENDWERIESWLKDSRQETLDFLRPWSDDALDWIPDRAKRSLQQTLTHLAYVEYMYAVWTFDLHSVEGLKEFLSWTRRLAADRMRELAARQDDRVTMADWAGAIDPEEWSARKAARRLLWHERLHLRSLLRHFGKTESTESP